MERILITGLGVVSCVGQDIETFWSALMGAASEPGSVPDPHAHMPNRLLYAVDEPPQAADARGNELSRTSAFAVKAAREALADAGLGEALDGAGDGIGVSIGTGVGDASLFESARAGGRVPSAANGFPFKTSGALAERFGLTGPNLTVSTACSASAYSASLAAQVIRDGAADVVLAGGADGYTRVGVACFNRMGGLDPVRCRPFDARREGTVFGEGAAMMVVESEEHWRRRGGRIAYAALEGAGWSCDAHHPTAPEPSGRAIARAMRAALREAGLDAEDIGCVVPHGTGTPLNDVVESRVLREVLALPDRTPPAVYSLKSMLGHTGGAAGGFAVLTAALILSRRTAPPNPPVAEPDPECPFALHTGEPQQRAFGHALVNAYAFGGNNISLVLGEV